MTMTQEISLGCAVIKGLRSSLTQALPLQPRAAFLLYRVVCHMDTALFDAAKGRPFKIFCESASLKAVSCVLYSSMSWHLTSEHA